MTLHFRLERLSTPAGNDSPAVTGAPVAEPVFTAAMLSFDDSVLVTVTVTVCPVATGEIVFTYPDTVPTGAAEATH